MAQFSLYVHKGGLKLMLEGGRGGGEDEVWGIENNELFFLYIYKFIVHAVLGC